MIVGSARSVVALLLRLNDRIRGADAMLNAAKLARSSAALHRLPTSSTAPAAASQRGQATSRARCASLSGCAQHPGRDTLTNLINSCKFPIMLSNEKLTSAETRK